MDAGGRSESLSLLTVNKFYAINQAEKEDECDIQGL
jgi:hypothetical protein